MYETKKKCLTWYLTQNFRFYSCLTLLVEVMITAQLLETPGFKIDSKIVALIKVFELGIVGFKVVVDNVGFTKEEEANSSGFKVVSDKVDPPTIGKLNTSGFKVVSDKAGPAVVDDLGPAVVDDLGPSVGNEVFADEMKVELLADMPWLELTKVVAEV